MNNLELKYALVIGRLGDAKYLIKTVDAIEYIIKSDIKLPLNTLVEFVKDRSDQIYINLVPEMRH